MARPALFVLAERRRYLRRFLSSRNQQNPKRSLGKMKAAAWPGRGGPRSCGGRGLAPARRRWAGETARASGVPRSLPSPGVHSGPPPPLEDQLPGVPCPPPPQPLSPASLPPLPPAHWRSPQASDFFKAALKPRHPAEGQEISHLDGVGAAAGWGGSQQPEPGLLAASDSLHRFPPPPAPLRSLRRARRTGAPPTAGPRPGGAAWAPPQPSGRALGSGGRTKPYCGWGMYATEWLLFRR